MFKLHDFIMKTVLGMVGSEPDFKVREYALGWYQKSVLTEFDLTEVEEALNKQEIIEEPIIEDVEEEENTEPTSTDEIFEEYIPENMEVEYNG